MARWRRQSLIASARRWGLNFGGVDLPDRGRAKGVVSRSVRRNGRRPELLSTPASDIAVGNPKLDNGRFFPEHAESRRQTCRTLWAQVMTADITGTSTRKVGDFVNALKGGRACASRPCRGSFRASQSRPSADWAASLLLKTPWHKARSLKIQDSRQIVSTAEAIAAAVRWNETRNPDHS